jgi:hypothetical protein
MDLQGLLQGRSELFYDRRSVGQSVVVSAHPIWDPLSIFISPQPKLSTGICGFLVWGALSDERMAFYGDSFIFLHVADVRTSQETHLWASRACYGDSFTLYTSKPVLQD